MSGKIINGIWYIELLYKNEFKKRSIEDNIYFTLRDIFWNCDSIDSNKANYFNSILIGGNNNINGYDEYNDITYTNVVHDENDNFVVELYDYLKMFKKNRFTFFIDDYCVFPDNELYLRFDIWWRQFEDLVLELHQIVVSRKNNENLHLESL